MEKSFKKFAADVLQPNSFSFNKENLNKANKILKMYPKNYRESSIMPLLTLAQEQNDGWIPKKAIEYISKFLKVSEIRVLELATFYSMYNLSPVGKFHIEVCTTSPCMLRGADSIINKCKKQLGIEIGELSKDKKFSLNHVECLGACVNAPVIKINKDYYEDITINTCEELINKLNNNKKPKIGPQSTRKGSEPLKGKAL
ncbi:MAG: NADH-quinone oxidoreductase subunit NuoE [Rickettsiales bacterium]|nr:NADH-quinone oxidoreductase subunit NuoE [Rickettsiales bacterium]|tara:strand:+ start:339 stop:938 length:600 start_codon:yes stop_codon:yes gene_type:complete